MDLSQLPRENGFRSMVPGAVIPIHGCRLERAKQRLLAKAD